MVRGTVTDAVTGQPIAEARVDDNYYGAGPTQPPPQAWTDAQGFYQLRTWQEEHTLAASAPAYQPKLATLLTSRSAPMPDGTALVDVVDFQLQPAENGAPASFRLDPKAFDDTVRHGGDAWQAGDYAKALALLLPAARSGHPIAQHRLGVMYVLGQGVDENNEQAVQWFRKAAAQGQGESQFSLGMRYILGQGVNQDAREAARWFKLAADQGVAVAQAALALRYFKGDGVAQDFVEAYKWATLASNAGFISSQIPQPCGGQADARSTGRGPTPCERVCPPPHRPR